MSSARRLMTERLVIATATNQHLLVEKKEPKKLEALVGGTVPDTWPPQGGDGSDLSALMDALNRGGPKQIGWWMRYVVLRRGPEGHPMLIGRVGLHGPVEDGRVQVYCSLLSEFRGQGYGREATGRLVDWALDHPGVLRVIAEPPLSAEGWIKALGELGFERDGDDFSDAIRGTAHFVRHREAWLRDSIALRRGAKLVCPPRNAELFGIPTLASSVFERLLREPLLDPEDMCREVKLYVQMLAEAAQSNPSVDEELARDIGRTCEGLLMAVNEATPDHARRMIQAAARYFVTEEDGDSDLEIGGLDEDAAVANAVAEHLGRSDLVADIES